VRHDGAARLVATRQNIRVHNRLLREALISAVTATGSMPIVEKSWT